MPNAGSKTADVADDAVDVPDGGSPPGLLRTVPELAYAPAAAGLCHGAPADLFGLSVWVDEGGLWLAPQEPTSSSAAVRVDSFGPGMTPRSPVVLVGESGEPIGIAVAVALDARCELRFYDRVGAPTGRVEAATSHCVSPSGAGPVLIWPQGRDRAGDDGAEDDGRIAWFDAASRRELTSLALGATPLTPAAAFGNALTSGGGSHWLVGTSRGLTAVLDPLGSGRIGPGAPPATSAQPRVVGGWDAQGGRVTSLVIAGEYALVTLADDDLAGLGRRLQGLHISLDGAHQVVISALGPPIEAPGPLTAHPVAFACGVEVVRRWYCPRDIGATVVAGGEGWLAGWHLPDGALAFERALDLTWTGVSLGREGWVAGGGSHWLPSGELGWRFVALDPSAAARELELAAGLGDACLPSPLWDSDGVLAVPLFDAHEVARAVLTGIEGPFGAAAGSPRPLGDARNSGRGPRSAEVCDDGVLRSVNGAALTDAIYGILYADGRAVAYGQRGERGLIRWLQGGRAAAELVVEGAVAIENLVVLPADVVVAAFFDSSMSGFAHIAGFRPSGEVLWSHPLSLEPGSMIGLVQVGPDEFIVGARRGDDDGYFRVSATRGELLERAYGDATTPFGMSTLRGDGAGGAIAVLDLETRIGLRRIDASLTQTHFATWEQPGRHAISLDAGVDAAGHTRVLVETGLRSTGEWEMHWLQFDRSLELVDEQRVPYAGYFATLPDGASLIAAVEGLVRISPTGAVGLPRPLGGGLQADLFPALRGVAASDDGFIVGYERRTEDGVELLWGWADRLGFSGCGQAGQCWGQPVEACDLDQECAIQGCVPATGACALGAPPAGRCER